MDVNIKLKNIINSQKASIVYRSHDYTIIHKIATYDAFINLFDLYPKEMEKYLLFSERGFGFQYKLFQEYVKNIEKELPFIFKKKHKYYKISSITDENLGIFYGIFSFKSFTDNNLCIKNLTKDLFTMNNFSKPYYIGKILSITDEENNSLMDNIVEYSFHKITLKDVAPFTTVNVQYLGIPPHYQLGSMVYINRIRKSIVDEYNDN